MKKRGTEFFKVLSEISYFILGTRNTYKLKYFYNRGSFPNFNCPSDLSERLLSMMLKPSFVKNAKYVDKILVRDYISSKGLSSILLKHYGVWEDPDQINFEALPEKFILKTNNGAGNHIICHDKSNLEISESIFQLKKNIKKGLKSGEKQYREILPKVFCEELIDLGKGEWPIDYKFTCINGEPYDIFVATERSTNTKYITFDMNWNILPYTKKEYLPVSVPDKPSQLEEMIKIAKLLSEDFEFVRVDLYEHKGKVFFSELTFSPWGGVMYSYTDYAIAELGKKFDL